MILPVKAKSRIKKPVGYTPDGEPLFDYRREIAEILQILVEKLKFGGDGAFKGSHSV